MPLKKASRRDADGLEVGALSIFIVTSIVGGKREIRLFITTGETVAGLIRLAKSANALSRGGLRLGFVASSALLYASLAVFAAFNAVSIAVFLMGSSAPPPWVPAPALAISCIIASAEYCGFSLVSLSCMFSDSAV